MIKVAVMGFGTVGSGVVEVLDENRRGIAESAGDEISVKYILDVRDFPDSPYGSLVIHDFSTLENDPEIKIVAETIGGAGVAYDFTKRCLLAGKSVVTSNKELVATHGLELMSIAKEKNVNYLFEASVGGGIPILRPISRCLSANRIEEVYGILNGTTNYILTEMIQCGSSFSDALRQAQELGYAELNPAADVEGHDACRKITILSGLCFGYGVDPQSVSTEGITRVELADVKYAAEKGYRIKLLGRAIRMGEGHITAYVAPHLVADTSLLSSVDGVMNAVVVKGNAVGETMFYGPGAGKRPTASAVVADIIDSAVHQARRRDMSWKQAPEGYFTCSCKLESRWYVRADRAIEGAQELISEGDEKAYFTPVMSKAALDERLAGAEVKARFRILD